MVVDKERGAKVAEVQKGDRYWQRKHQFLDDGAETGALLVVSSNGKHGLRAVVGGCS